MKIVLVITDMGSFNNFLSELARSLVQNGFEVHVICSKSRVIRKKDIDEDLKERVRFYFVDLPRKFSFARQFKASWQIRNIIKSIRPHLVHVHFTTAVFTSTLFKIKSIPYWGTFHGLGVNSTHGFSKIIFYLVEYFGFFKLDQVFVVNQDDYAYLNFLGKKRVKYSSFGFGCDIRRFDQRRFSLDERIVLRKELGITNEKVIVFIGRFVHFKGFDLVIRSFNYLSDSHPRAFKLLLVGGFDDIHTTGLTPGEEKNIAQHPDIIQIGYTEHAEQYLSIADIFLFPSKKEGLPTCIVESLAMGVPVVAVDARGSRDIIQDGINGILVEQGKETNQIIQAIERLSRDIAFADTISNNALKGRQKYSRDRFIDEHISWYRRLIV